MQSSKQFAQMKKRIAKHNPSIAKWHKNVRGQFWKSEVDYKGYEISYEMGWIGLN